MFGTVAVCQEAMGSAASKKLFVSESVCAQRECHALLFYKYVCAELGVLAS